MKTRQKQIFEWAVAVFGRRAGAPKERGMRLLEEAIELAQAVGVAREDAQRLVGFVFDKPVGDINQEIGGVGFTLEALAESVGVNAQAETDAALERGLARGKAYFQARHAAKVEAGVAD